MLRLTTALLGLALALPACQKGETPQGAAKGATSEGAAAAKGAASKAATAASKAAAPASKAAAAASAAASGAAAPGSAAAPAAVSAEAKKNAETTVALMEQMGKLMAANATDCDKMAAELEAFTAKNKDQMEAVKTANKGLTPDQRKAAIAPYEQRMRGAMMQIMGPGMKCKDNPKVQAAMKKM